MIARAARAQPALWAIALLVLRRIEPDRKRSFRTPFAWVVAPLTVIGCIFLFVNLPWQAIVVLFVWGAIGLAIYYGYSKSRSHLGRGVDDPHEAELAGLQPPPPFP